MRTNQLYVRPLFAIEFTMSRARRYLPSYTVRDYMLWEGDWELWDGIPVAMTPSPFGPHSQVVARLITSLQLAIERADCDATVLTELDWIISDDTVVRPDVLVVGGSAPPEHLHDTPAMIAEVLSPSTHVRDQNEKRDLYAQQGVKHYLIVDPDPLTVTECRLEQPGVYTERQVRELVELEIRDDCLLRIELNRLSR